MAEFWLYVILVIGGLIWIVFSAVAEEASDPAATWLRRRRMLLDAEQSARVRRCAERLTALRPLTTGRNAALMQAARRAVAALEPKSVLLRAGVAPTAEPESLLRAAATPSSGDSERLLRASKQTLS